MAGYEKNNVFAKVVLNLPIQRHFDYNIPDALLNKVSLGSGVFAPFGSKRLIGYVVDFAKKTDIDIKHIRDIEGVVRDAPLIDEDMMRLLKWLSEYYFCSLGEAIAAAVPAAVRGQRTEVRGQKTQDRGEKINDINQNSNQISLTKEQQSALKEILNAMHRDKHKVFLLHGITGSGKTEVYLRSIAEVLKNGRSSIVLVPEISLTAQTISRFKERFGDAVAVLHSHLTDRERREQWTRIETQDARVVVGARSAVFAPVKRLGLIVIDEEHETTYKQDDTPRYNARDVAIKRASLTGGIVILGSATPSVESYYNAARGRYRLLSLSSRIEQRELPKIEVVDMRQEMATQRRIPIFSRLLQEKIRQVIETKQQAILFLNRRGFATYVICKKCQTVLKCRRCQVVLTFHFQLKRLLCHYCHSQAEAPEVCPACKGSYLTYRGIGTEKVESETYRFFPNASIARMDIDTTKRRGSHNVILGDFAAGRVSLLVGTQMIAKGLDFPDVTLVGVILADIALNQPDFRAAERCFNLITQVAGRAGRGEKGGEVILQTYCPNHYAIVAATNHDYKRFYEDEIAIRKELKFPPFNHLVSICLRGRSLARLRDASSKLVSEIKKHISAASSAGRNIALLGAGPAPIPRLRGQHRYIILLKGKTPEAMNIILRKTLKKYTRYRGLLATVDVDPYKMV